MERNRCQQSRPWWIWGGVLGGLGVLLGAFGAHGLKSSPAVLADPSLLDTWETAARYQLVHALALLAVASHPRSPRWSGRLFVAGTCVFSGSLYLLVLTGVRWLGAITPLGGLALCAGWAVLAVASSRMPGASEGGEMPASGAAELDAVEDQGRGPETRPGDGVVPHLDQTVE